MILKGVHIDFVRSFIRGSCAVLKGLAGAGDGYYFCTCPITQTTFDRAGPRVKACFCVPGGFRAYMFTVDTAF